MRQLPKDKFVVFSLVIKMGVAFKARLLKDVLFCRLVVRSGVNFEEVLFQIFGHQAANDEYLATVGPSESAKSHTPQLFPNSGAASGWHA